ncbi:MAG: triose-phosphate isomerase [Chlamydiales bacterium]
MAKKSKKQILIAGNWKMYKTVEEAKIFLKTLAPLIEESQATVYLAVPFTAIHPMATSAEELKASIIIGAQNMNDASEGAFTGEIAGRMLKEAGAQFVILGHSERRHIFCESDAFINKKIKRAFLEGIQPVLCIGETLSQHENGKIFEVLEQQLLGSLQDLSKEEISSLILSYEPVWAIGTGQVAHPDDAETAIASCREVIAENWGKVVAKKVTILYGGSVNPENAPDLLAQRNIDGLLVGGASLSPQTFSQIINIYKE